MNILKEFAKIFIKSKLDDEKRKLKDKLQKQIIQKKKYYMHVMIVMKKI